MRVVRCSAWALVAAGLAWSWPGSALAQRRGSAEIEPSASVMTAIGAPYLSEEERSAKRVFHGLWTESDLSKPSARATAALIAGVWDDASFDSAEVGVEDRAEAALARGEHDRALALLDGARGLRASRLRGEAFESMGRLEEAKKAFQFIAAELGTRRAEGPSELVEGVRAMRALAELEGKPARDYQTMLDLLLKAQQEMDRLYWPAVVEQAELLYDKDNMGEALVTAVEALTLNPTSHRAWRVLGQAGVDQFNFAQTETVAQKLSDVARRVSGDTTRTHPVGDLLQARAWMRQNDPEFALEHVGRALARHPRMPEALALEAAGVAMTYDYERAERLLAALDGVSPGSARGLYEVGKALAENRQYEQAGVFLRRAVERRPNWPQPGIELGLMEMQSGRDTLALSALRAATRLDPHNIRAGNSLKLVEDLSGYASFESEHFVVRAARGVDEVMAREMPAILEEIHEHVRAGIDFTPPIKTTIEIHPDHETFAVRITGMTGIHTIAAATGPVIAMEAPKIGKKHTGLYDWVRVIRHEYVHTVTLARTNNRIPHWFTEAAAVYLEGAPRDYETCVMLAKALDTGELFDLKAINIAFVRPKKPTDRAQAYAQGHWMYEYIVYRWGARAPLELMDQYRDGVREEEAMSRVLGVSGEDFVREFEVWARGDARSWGLLATPSIPDLLVRETLADDDRRAKAVGDLARFAAGADAAAAGLAAPRPFELDVVEPDEAMAARWLEEHPAHPDVLELNVLYALKGSGGEPTAEMIPLLERYAEARPVDPMPHKHLARLYLAGDDASKAVAHLEFLDAREQKSPAYAVELSKQYAALEEWERAGVKAERATQIAPFDANKREFAASVALQRGDLETAERHILALTDLEPQHEVHRARLSRVRELRGGK